MENKVAIILNDESSIQEVMEAAPSILMQAQEIVSNAEKICAPIFERIEKEGMSDEIDSLLNQVVVKCTARLDQISGDRKPVTQWFDKIRKQFTELEAKLDPAKPGSLVFIAKSHRNSWATHKINLQKQKEAEAAKKLAADQEKITLKAEAEIQIKNAFIRDLATAKRMLQDVFDSTTLDNYEEHAGKIFNYSEIYTIAEFNAIPVNLRPIYLSAVEVENIITNARIGKYEAWVQEYKSEMRQLKSDLTLKLNGKKIELEAIKKAAEEKAAAEKKAAEAKSEADKKAAQKRIDDARIEQERLDKIKKDREDAERIAAAEKEKQDLENAAKENEAEKQVGLTNSLFDNQVALAQEVEQVKAIESYEITVTNSAAWLLIASKWHANEGAKLTNAEIEKKTFKQMKTFCEKLFKSTGEKIDSPFLIYSPVYKAKTEK